MRKATAEAVACEAGKTILPCGSRFRVALSSVRPVLITSLRRSRNRFWNVSQRGPMPIALWLITTLVGAGGEAALGNAPGIGPFGCRRRCDPLGAGERFPASAAWSE